MASNKIGVNFSAKTKELEQGAKKAEKAIRALQGDVSKLAGSFNKAQKEMRTMRNSFANITGDANRANSAFGKLGKTLKIGLGVSALYGTANALKLVVEKAMESTETLNLFEVAMGSATKATEEFVQETNKAFGFDVTNIRSAVGTYALLAKSMGITSDNARTLSENTYKLAVDLASLTNVPINQVLADLRSGLVGQSETVYKYGIDVTEASLATEAMNQGINKSVRNMSQGEKMALRYGVMLRQTKLAQGDFANTIDTASNQLRIAKEQLVTLVRTIGTAFIPILTQVLPYINGFISALITLAKSIATLFGFKAKDPLGIERGAQVSDEISDNMADGAGSAKKMKDYLSGMDELNVLNTDSGSGSSGAGVQAGDPNLFKFGEYDNLMDEVKNKADEIGKSVSTAFASISEKLTPLLAPLQELGNISLTGLSWLWENVLVPFGSWTWNNLIPVALEAIAGALEFLSGVLEVGGSLFSELWVGFLKPISTFTAPLVVGVLDGVGTALDAIGNWMSDNLETMKLLTKVVLAFFGAWKVTELFAFIQLSGGVVEAFTLITNAIKGATLAKIADKWETVILTAMYAGDFVKSIASTIVQFGLQTGALIANKVAVMASIVQQGLLTAGLWLYNTAMIAVNVVTGIFTGLLAVLTSPITLVIAGIAGLVAGSILLYKNWDKVTESLKKVWEKFTTFIKGTPDILLALAGPLQPILMLIKHWDLLKGTVVNVVNTIIRFVNGMTDAIAGGLNSAIEMLNNFKFELPDWMGGGTFGFNIAPVVNNLRLKELAIEAVSVNQTANITGQKVQKFATGGFPNQGEMFIAREAGAEMVGSIGGRTAVANNDQIVQAVAQGVADAVARVMQSGGQVIENVLMLDGDVIYKNQQQVARRRGTDFGMGVFAR